MDQPLDSQPVAQFRPEVVQGQPLVVEERFQRRLRAIFDHVAFHGRVNLRVSRDQAHVRRALDEHPLVDQFAQQREALRGLLARAGSLGQLLAVRQF